MEKRNSLNYPFRIVVGIMVLVLLFAGNANAAVDDIEVKITNIWGSDYPILLFNQSTALGQVRTADLDSSPISEPVPTLVGQLTEARNYDKSVVSRFKISDKKVRILVYIAGGRPFWPGSEGYLKITNPEWKITEILKYSGDYPLQYQYYGYGNNIDMNNGTIDWQMRGGCPDCANNENEFIVEFIVEKTKLTNITASADTYSYFLEPDTNMGGLRYGWVWNYYARQSEYGFIKFANISGMGNPNIPSNSIINSATMWLNICSFWDTQTISFYTPSASWDEYTLTWNNQPSIVTPYASVSINGSTQHWVSINVTDIVRKWNDGTLQNDGVVVLSDGGGVSAAMNWSSKENLTNKPYISVDYTLPPIRFINGTVKDNSTGDSLADVTVSANSTLSTITNTTGFYSFAVSEGSYNLTASFDIRFYTNTTTVSTVGKAVVLQDIELLKKPTGNITGSVRIFSN